MSHNYRTLEVYSGTAGAYLNIHEPPNWFHETLIPASIWLKQHNDLIKNYASNINIIPTSSETPVPILLPLARQSINTQESFPNLYRSTLLNEILRPSDLVVPNNPFPLEIHDEDSNYNRLIARSINTTNRPILFNNPDLEALIFLNLFPNAKGHYENIKQLLNFHLSIESYEKYIKLRMFCPDPRFRLHWYWPHWSYLNLEKKRNFQNQHRILSTHNVNKEHHPTKADLISKSSYNDKNILDESITTTLPSSFRTASPFFKKKQL
ncbi:12015_t:CDS:1 [Ambispora leptoticha]|uniref:12015_t:CDS:1 n=1 Tax=Ambispora leptoticha TaxID=144679 RepID=A0A9N9HPN0_9GLOM|nr:12015_t:CDS:1 [Ambispora leptoticha]